jgi:hypothetical protein
MHHLIQQTHIPEEARDTLTYMWGKFYLCNQKNYHHPFQNIHPPKPFIWIWDSSCANKLRVFAWLLLMDRLNVKNILRRKSTSCKTMTTIVSYVMGRNNISLVFCMSLQSGILASSENPLEV